jgi:hypothetical protein
MEIDTPSVSWSQGLCSTVCRSMHYGGCLS